MAMKAHVIDYQIFGDDMQFVQVELDPQETVIAEAGMMMYMDAGVTFETRLGDGSNPDQGFLGKLGGVARRAITGESLFNPFHQQRAGAAAGRLRRALPRQDYPHRPGRGARRADLPEGFLPGGGAGHRDQHCLQQAAGRGPLRRRGLHSATATRRRHGFHPRRRHDYREAAGGQKLLVVTGCLVAFENTIDYDIERAGNMRSMLFGGEGLFLATLQGTGRVWLQSLPFSRLADRIIAAAPSTGGKSTGEGSVIRGLSNLLEQ